MAESYRRRKPSISERRGLLAEMSQQRGRATEWQDPKYDLSQGERRAYGMACRNVRAAYGLTDGLRLSQSDFNAYLEKRRAEDKTRRGW